MLINVFDEPILMGINPETDYFLYGMFLTDIMELELLILLLGAILVVFYLEIPGSCDTWVGLNYCIEGP